MSVALPCSWTEAPIGTLCVNTEQVTPDAEAEFIYVDIASVDRETKKITSPQRMLGKDAPSRARKLIKTGDTIVSTTRPNLNAVALVDQTLDGQIASTGFDVLRAPGLDPRWLGYLVRTSAFVDAMSSLVQGALYPAIRGKDVRSFTAPIAPEKEQKRIADKLDTVLTRVDAVNTRLARVAPLLKRFRQSVLAAATSGRLTEDWRGGAMDWTSVPAAEICEKVQSGGTPKAGFAEAGVPFLKVYNIVDQRVAFDYKPQFVSQAIHESELRKSQVFPNDVLMNIVGPPLGKVAVVPADHSAWNINQAITLFRPSTKITSQWIYILLCEGAPIRDVLARTKGSVGQVNISLSQCRAFEFQVPSVEEQTEIVRRVETLFAFADQLEARLAQAQTAATRLTPALLAKAFRGELVPQDPNDEPAAELLRRLQAQRATGAPASKTGAGRGRGRKAAASAAADL